MNLAFTEEMLPPSHTSWNKVLAGLGTSAREAIIASLSDGEVVDASTDWFLQARREQIPPLWDWFVWIIMAGRGFGKNFAGSNWLINEHVSGHAKNSGIIAATSADLRRFCVEGPSGILSQAPDWFRPSYKPATSKLVWPDGATTSLFTSEIPDRLRGPNLDKVWCDELAAWRYLDDTWDMLQLCLRYGDKPQCLVTTTPRPKKILRDLLKRVRSEDLPDGNVALSFGSTYDNADNLPGRYIEEITSLYKGTRLERQEIYGELLDEFEGSLWSYKLLDECRVSEHPILTRIGIGVDPAITSNEDSDLTGIVAAGTAANRQGYVIGEHSLRGSPEQWGMKVAALYHDLNADFVVAEQNQGGEMVESTIRAVDSSVNVRLVHASKGKVTRAEPISAMYEQNRIHHVGTFAALEDEMCLFLPGEIKQKSRGKKSPDRADALVYVLTELMDGPNKVAPRIRAI